MLNLPDRLASALGDRYVIESELGAGGMAIVFLAEDRKHKRKVAVKVLREELAAAVGPERFLREIEITAQLTHPHILPLHDSGEVDGLLYYVMPYIEGESLRDRLHREKQLPLEDAIAIVREVADALERAHDHGVVHRDIKPENILLDGRHALVADFGIARALETAGTTHLTGAGLAVGTTHYMSPEQSSGTADIDGRSDLYSLACVFYEMLAGTPPFTGATPDAVIRQHLTANVPAITVTRPNVPSAVVAALEKALAKAAAMRALALDSTSAEAHTALGEARKLDWDWDGAEESYVRAIGLNPGYATAHQWYGYFLAQMGRFDQAFVTLDRAVELDPLSSIIRLGRAGALLFADRFEEALREAQATTVIDPEHPFAYHMASEALIGLRRFDEADVTIAEFKRRSTSPVFLEIRARATRLQGEQPSPDIEAELQRFLEAGAYVRAGVTAATLKALGKDAEALEWLERAVENRDDWLVNARGAPWWDLFRNEPRFQEILRQLSFQQ